MDFSRIKNLIKQNGDKFIMMENGEPEMVVMSFGEYEHMISERNHGKAKEKNDLEDVFYAKDGQTKKETEDFPFSPRNSFFDEDEPGKKRGSYEEGEDDEFFSAFAEEDTKEKEREQEEEEEENRDDFLRAAKFIESDAREYVSPQAETGSRVLLRDMEKGPDHGISLGGAPREKEKESERISRLEDIRLGDLPV